MLKYISEEQRLQRIYELEMIWLDFYRHRDNISVEQWKEYERVINEYLRLIL